MKHFNFRELDMNFSQKYPKNLIFWHLKIVEDGLACPMETEALHLALHLELAFDIFF